jgi:hypothetical protein
MIVLIMGSQFITSGGSGTLFGPCVLTDRVHVLNDKRFQFRLLYQSPGTPFQMYTDVQKVPSDPERMQLLGFEDNGTLDSITLKPSQKSPMWPTMLLLVSECPVGLNGSSGEAWHFSSCPLHDIAEMVCCEAHQRVYGILFRYHNGGSACVGEFRWDWVLEPVRPGTCQTMRLRVDRAHNWRPCVTQVSFDEGPPADGIDASEEPEPEWLSFPLRGKLEWWCNGDMARLAQCDVDGTLYQVGC